MGAYIIFMNIYKICLSYLKNKSFVFNDVMLITILNFLKKMLIHTKSNI